MIPRDETAAGLIGDVRSRRITASEVLESHLHRIREADPVVHAFLHVDEEGARAAARRVDSRLERGESAGPLAGLPVAVKDNICTKDLPTTCASRILQGYRPVYDATAVARLREAGAVILGKTNLDEFGMGSSTENSAFGATKNPWDTSRVPGGSSGGSAAAVAVGMVPAALGSDTGGSVRQPAGLCGLVGFKPQYGTVSRSGLVAFASSLDQIGLMARTARDAALLYNAVAGHDPLDSTSLPSVPAIRLEALDGTVRDTVLGVPRTWVEGCDAEVRAVFDETLGVLQSLGVTFRDVTLPEPGHAISAYYILADAEASSNLARYDGVRYGPRAKGVSDLESLYTKTRGRGFGREVKRRVILGTHVLSSGYYEAYYAKAQKARRHLRAALDDALRETGGLLLPTAPTPAFRLGEKIDDPVAMYLSDAFTITASLAGYPALSFPGGFTPAGLPVGMQLYGGTGSEELLLRVATAHEGETDIPRMVPPGGADGGGGG